MTTTVLDFLAKMPKDELRARIEQVCDIKQICEEVVARRNNNVKNSAAAGQVLNILLHDMAESKGVSN